MSEHERRLLLLVDDTPANLSLLNAVLKNDYRLRIAGSGALALELARRLPHPDLVLLDVMMPEMDGYEVCRQMAADPALAHIPVIFLTARTEEEDEARGFSLGAVDYIHKPFSPLLVQMRVRNQLELYDARERLRRQNEWLEQKVGERTAELVKVQDATMLAMGVMAELRDNETGMHLKRTQEYLRLLALAARERCPDYAVELDDPAIHWMSKSAPLHDIGKVGVPDAVLHKPGPLSEAEFALMKHHPTYGRDIIVQVEQILGEETSFLRYAREIAYGHQEKWDGSGYPQGVSGTAIPLSARLMALADVYDALISRRVYKPPLAHDKAVEIIAKGKGTHFDPVLVEVFLEIHAELHAIALQYADPADPGLYHDIREAAESYQGAHI
ncbi:response regulator [Chitinilyticum piscinae]|uniref:Response regulator n=1 Tax=Chitinilyticum piscinae TaxID=2866724 RepID=A0A8J7FLJ6_9NEIS|nr:HD domain-containing phosphohydrolase [Chitinilyticum piscinae]MBE9610307.1 response regulator [Chitinilyticum piscinae]